MPAAIISAGLLAISRVSDLLTTLERLVGALKHDALLGIGAVGLVGRHGEERRIERLRVLVQEVGALDVDL